MLCRAREKGERFTACLSCESLQAVIQPQFEVIGHNLWQIRFSASTTVKECRQGDSLTSGTWQQSAVHWCGNVTAYLNSDRNKQMGEDMWTMVVKRMRAQG